MPLLRRLPAPIQKRIRAKVQAYVKAPASQANNVTVLKSRTGTRLCVGDWRVIIDDGGAVLADWAAWWHLRLMEAGMKNQGLSETVMIPRVEYEALRAAAETLSDVRAYDAARVALDEGRDELVPEPFASRLMDGVEHPLTVYRELRGLSNVQLARASGINRVQIRDIEAGPTHGSARTVMALAEALRVDAGDLVT